MADTRSPNRALILNNNVEIAEILLALLQANKYDVAAEIDSSSGLKTVKSFLPHVLLLTWGFDHGFLRSSRSVASNSKAK